MILGEVNQSHKDEYDLLSPSLPPPLLPPSLSVCAKNIQIHRDRTLNSGC